MTDCGFDNALRAFDTSTPKLGVDYVDLYLLHWPWPPKWSGTVAAYRAAERLLADGRLRAIGVANSKPEHLRALVIRPRHEEQHGAVGETKFEMPADRVLRNRHVLVSFLPALASWLRRKPGQPQPKSYRAEP